MDNDRHVVTTELFKPTIKNIVSKEVTFRVEIFTSAKNSVRNKNLWYKTK